MLKRPFPDSPLIAGGGVNQQNAAHYILAGVSAISVGKELIPRESMLLHKPDRIRELTKRFATIVRTTRARLAEAQAQVANFRYSNPLWFTLNSRRSRHVGTR